MNSMKRHAVAAACVMACGAAQAVVSVTGSWQVLPAALPIGPGDTDLGADSSLELGRAAVGGLTVNAGSTLVLGRLKVGNQGTGSATVTLDGAGSTIRIRGNGDGNRLEVGNYGVGSMTVSGGATLDGRFDAAACSVGPQFCNNFIGNAAGSDATFTVTGSGSNASFMKGFIVGGLSVNNATFGTPGGSTTGRVNVLNGGVLTTDRATLAQGPSGSFALGSERSFATVTISGPGSRWNLSGGALDGSTASMSTATHANATAVININNGGVLNLQQVPATTHFINLSSGAGRTDMVVTGTGSAVNLDGGVFQVGRGLYGTARLEIMAGGAVNDAFYMSVGRGGSNGRLVLDGAGSRITVSRRGVPGSVDAGFLGGFDIGRDGGTGQVDITNGGRLEVLSLAGANERARTLFLGRDTSQGTLNVSGADSRVVLSAVSGVPGGGPGEALNPFMVVGHEGVGYLNVTGGAKVLINGGAVSTVADGRTTGLIVGGRDDVNPGGQGFATISGAGSEVRVNGSDSIIWVGRGPGSSGQMTVSAGALVDSTALLVGRNGGAVGIVNIDNATVRLSGQQTGNTLSGAGAVIGSGVGSTGVLNMSNGALLDIRNVGGTADVSFNVGGSTTAPGGDGVLRMSGGSRIQLTGPTSALSFVSIGRDGSGLARVSGASSIDVGGGNLFVGRFTGADGTLIVTEGSTITAGFVGVGRNRLAGGSTVDGGTGTFILNNATLNAVDVVIGTNGFLGGTAGSINVSGSVTNYGIFSPGNSPGRFTVNGNYVAGAGSRLVLEVQSNGAGGFDVDELVFGAGASLDLAALRVEFRFLGGTDPVAFSTAGLFDIDTFVRQADAGGVLQGLPDAAYNGVQYSALADGYVISNFSYAAGGAATFTATPVPEPAAWVLMLGGGLAGALLARKRRTAAPAARERTD